MQRRANQKADEQRAELAKMEKQLLSEQNKAKTAEATIAGLQSVAALREKALEQYEKVQKSYERDIEGLRAQTAALADKLADAEEQIKRLKEEVSNADRIKDALCLGGMTVQILVFSSWLKRHMPLCRW